MLNEILLMAPQAGADGQQGGNPWAMWIMLGLIFVVMYLFMIRPQQKKQKELQAQRDAMKKGDKVVTAGGIYGEIKEISDTTILMTIAKDVVIKVDKNSVFVSADDAAQNPQK